MARTGRPKKNESKNVRVTVRLTEKEAEQLRFLTNTTDDNVTDIMRKGLRMMWNLEKNKV